MNNPVVSLEEINPGVVQLTMCDRDSKNTFSPALTEGLMEAFAQIKENQDYHAVVLTGYDNYFASGGTQEGLLAIYDGDMQFTDFNIYSLAVDCPIPVISAMKGHAVGGGFVMGLYADFVVMAQESFYTANFMKYGFTPGMGATYILPKKLGFSLGEELLIGALNYQGRDLEKRGIPFPVLPKNEVLPYAHKLARQLAERPRLSLITLKTHLVAHIRSELPQIIQQEVAMHEDTFHQPAVKERIMRLFGK